jgi:hypothetical protein
MPLPYRAVVERRRERFLSAAGTTGTEPGLRPGLREPGSMTPRAGVPGRRQRRPRWRRGGARGPQRPAPLKVERRPPGPAGAGVGPATPSRRLGVPSRQRGTPPEDVRSPQQKRGCLGDGAARARRGDGGRSPAASKGLDFGSTPARVGAPIGGESGDSGPSLPPLSRVLDYSSSTPGPAAAPPPAPSEVRGPGPGI